MSNSVNDPLICIDRHSSLPPSSLVCLCQSNFIIINLYLQFQSQFYSFQSTEVQFTIYILEFLPLTNHPSPLNSSFALPPTSNCAGLPTMVYYFTSNAVSPSAFIYVGKDKFESMPPIGPPGMAS